MKRAIRVLIILLITIVFNKFLMPKCIDFLKASNLFSNIGELSFIVGGILVGAIYWFQFGNAYSHIEVESPSKFKKRKLSGIIPAQKYIESTFLYFWKYIKNTRLGRYLQSVYEAPVQSEQMLGGFFYGKAIITTVIAFYYLDLVPLIAILIFSAVFDSMTGTYQHSLMNFFHKTIFKNRFFAFMQNLFKRYIVDVFRAEVLTLLIMGISTFSLSEQYHILQNRFVSASYYFNAVIIDKLVDLGAISRNFRSKFVVIASTIGGMLCLLDFAKTDFPKWIPQEMIQSIPTWIPGPLKLLAYFNISVFILAALTYLWTITLKNFRQNNYIPSIINKNYIYARVLSIMNFLLR